jgi:hypothetical protein
MSSTRDSVFMVFFLPLQTIHKVLVVPPTLKVRAVLLNHVAAKIFLCIPLVEGISSVGIIDAFAVRTSSARRRQPLDESTENHIDSNVGRVIRGRHETA